MCSAHCLCSGLPHCSSIGLRGGSLNAVTQQDFPGAVCLLAPSFSSWSPVTFFSEFQSAGLHTPWRDGQTWKDEYELFSVTLLLLHFLCSQDFKRTQRGPELRQHDAGQGGWYHWGEQEWSFPVLTMGARDLLSDKGHICLHVPAVSPGDLKKASCQRAPYCNRYVEQTVLWQRGQWILGKGEVTVTWHL